METAKVFKSVAESAEFLGVKGSRVRQLLASGALRGEKVGSQWVIHVEELRRFKAIDRPAGNPNFKKLATA